MKIALLGYGKMGQIIERFALERGHDVTLKVGIENLDDFTIENLSKADIAIDFSAPDAAVNNIYKCFEAKVPVVVGTTGWYGELQKIKNDCIESNNTLLYGSNFSVGVNIFFHLNKLLARVMNNYPAYDVQVEEIHHTQKLDSPSGTAMTIAEGILEEIEHKTEWVNELEGAPMPDKLRNDQLLIESLRMENVPGTHTVVYSSEVDDIEIKHTAHSRAGFALGAVIAAEWLQHKRGFFSIADVFNFKD
ncbi:4-hydroxy-tetrahydrodipicolinate reductase [Pedobacter sp. ASV28]|uniref:4-hydroxy-tetrahydrodipicolinate reductase n=1 Tax=Pedobacter sp. ASV28 TaxID=2795123 RepID=UPI0018EBC5FE|nr:4-hydroxy-tetrahydrodipicolinate reductase [Pedobacter sp. ASV28]